MSSSKRRASMSASALVAGVALLGCAKTAPTKVAPPPPPNPQAEVAADPNARVHELARKAEHFASDSHTLPGNTADQHRQIVHQLFSALSEILPLLAGPEPGLVFRQQLATLQGANDQLANGSAQLSMEPAIDTGLRAATSALQGIAREGYYEQADLTPLFEKLRAKLNDLDTVHGSAHMVVVTEAV